MHNILDNFFDDNSFLKTMIKKDKIRTYESYGSYENTIFTYLNTNNL